MKLITIGNLRSLISREHPKMTPLSIDEVMNAYHDVSTLYPFAPSMSIWRAWELAAYRRYKLPGPILDLGCGDGQYFKLVWPSIKDVVGIDIDSSIIDSAVASGVYTSVLETSAANMSIADSSFNSVFANCSLEHMDDLDSVLANVRRVLRPNGAFLLSVVTDKFLEWVTLADIASLLDGPARGSSIINHYSSYHHLVTALPPERWVSRIESAGFNVLEHTPIMPELVSRLDLFVDCLWHQPDTGKEFGAKLHESFKSIPHFPEVLGDIVKALLVAEKSATVGSGAVFYAKRKS